MKKLLFVLLLASPIIVRATNVYLSFTFIPNTNYMAGLSTNDYTTNLVVNILSTVNVNTPTNKWPVVQSAPMTGYAVQGPVGSTWTNMLITDAVARFYAIQITNYNGVLSSFSSLAPALPAVEAGVINQPLKVTP